MPNPLPSTADRTGDRLRPHIFLEQPNLDLDILPICIAAHLAGLHPLDDPIHFLICTIQTGLFVLSWSHVLQPLRSAPSAARPAVLLP